LQQLWAERGRVNQDGIDARTEGMGELSWRVTRPYGYHAAAQQVCGHADGKRLRRDASADRDPGTRLNPDAPHRTREPLDDLQELTS
jgi:hypothetical protein